MLSWILFFSVVFTVISFSFSSSSSSSSSVDPLGDWLAYSDHALSYRSPRFSRHGGDDTFYNATATSASGETNMFSWVADVLLLDEQRTALVYGVDRDNDNRCRLSLREYSQHDGAYIRTVWQTLFGANNNNDCRLAQQAGWRRQWVCALETINRLLVYNPVAGSLLSIRRSDSSLVSAATTSLADGTPLHGDLSALHCGGNGGGDNINFYLAFERRHAVYECDSHALSSQSGSSSLTFLRRYTVLNPRWLQLIRAASQLVVTSNTLPTQVWRLRLATGTLASASTLPTLTIASSTALSQDGRYVFTAHDGADVLRVYDTSLAFSSNHTAVPLARRGMLVSTTLDGVLHGAGQWSMSQTSPQTSLSTVRRVATEGELARQCGGRALEGVRGLLSFTLEQRPMLALMDTMGLAMYHTHVQRSMTLTNYVPLPAYASGDFVMLAFMALANNATRHHALLVYYAANHTLAVLYFSPVLATLVLSKQYPLRSASRVASAVFLSLPVPSTAATAAATATTEADIGFCYVHASEPLVHCLTSLSSTSWSGNNNNNNRTFVTSLDCENTTLLALPSGLVVASCSSNGNSSNSVLRLFDTTATTQSVTFGAADVRLPSSLCGPLARDAYGHIVAPLTGGRALAYRVSFTAQQQQQQQQSWLLWRTNDNTCDGTLSMLSADWIAARRHEDGLTPARARALPHVLVVFLMLFCGGATLAAIGGAITLFASEAYRRQRAEYHRFESGIVNASDRVKTRRFVLWSLRALRVLRFVAYYTTSCAPETFRFRVDSHIRRCMVSLLRRYQEVVDPGVVPTFEQCWGRLPPEGCDGSDVPLSVMQARAHLDSVLEHGFEADMKDLDELSVAALDNNAAEQQQQQQQQQSTAEIAAAIVQENMYRSGASFHSVPVQPSPSVSFSHRPASPSLYQKP